MKLDLIENPAIVLDTPLIRLLIGREDPEWKETCISQIHLVETGEIREQRVRYPSNVMHSAMWQETVRRRMAHFYDEATPMIVMPGSTDYEPKPV